MTPSSQEPFNTAWSGNEMEHPHAIPAASMRGQGVERDVACLRRQIEDGRRGKKMVSMRPNENTRHIMQSKPEPLSIVRQGSIISGDSTAEIARSLGQARLFCQVLGLFPHALPVKADWRLLDLACGPGGWAQEVAFAYPDMRVVGVDNNFRTVEYAEAHASAQQLENISFEVMDILQPFPFPKDSFDAIQGSFLIDFMTPEDWPWLLKECRKVLTANGFLCLTEAEWPRTNSTAFEHYIALISEALTRAKRSLVAESNRLGITSLLADFLQDAGYQAIEQQAYHLNFSAGTALFSAMTRNYLVVFHLVQPFLLEMSVVVQPCLERLYQQVLIDTYCETFCAEVSLLSAWGRNP